MSHPALEHNLIVRAASEVVLCVRERHHGAPPPDLSMAASLEELAAALDEAGQDFLLVQVDRGQVCLRAGVHGTAPLYLAGDGDTLEASWDITALRRWCRPDKLIDGAIARALTRRHRYSSDTPFASIVRLTERATATWSRGQLAVSYPHPAPHVARARSLRPEVDPVAAFDVLATHVINRRLLPQDGIAVELSGGADSANVALTVAKRDGAAASIGLVLPGAVGHQQAARRSSITWRLGLRDLTIAAADHLPFVKGGRRSAGLPHDPVGDFYLEAFQTLADRATAGGIRVLLTGIGGDEIMAPRPSERTTCLPQPPHVTWLGPRSIAALDDLDTNTAPVAPVPLPSLMAFAARNPSYLRRGIWPVSPLADPLLVRFAESLPLRWRRRKRLMRLRLHRAGMPPAVVRPTQPETFLPVMQQGLRRYGLALARDMLAESILIDAGYINSDTLRRAVRALQDSATIPDILYDTVALEVGLRSMVEAR